MVAGGHKLYTSAGYKINKSNETYSYIKSKEEDKKEEEHRRKERRR